MLTDDLTEEELNVFTILERGASVASLLGCVVIIVTFSLSKSFHKPINRLVFYASLGNLMTNVATLMARTYVGDTSSAGCQLQAFLIQMFMPADAFWTLAMAVNVYLTFYRKYDAQKLRKMEIPYLLLCYGLPFIVAITYIFIETPGKGRMYGNATIWCWIQQSWDVWRIATFYGPVWVVITITFFIYIRAGREIYRKHQQLKDLHYTSHYEPEPLPINEVANSKTTEVSVTVTSAGEAIDLAPLGVNMNKHDSISGHSLGDPSPYSVSISAKPQSAAESSAAAAAAAEAAAANNTSRVSTYGAQQGQGFQPPGLPKMPSRRKITLDAHNAAWSYTKVALLFFTAMLVTWIPSSMNRLYSLVEAGQISLPLEYMSAFVLPLQGFWNAVIYVITSWKACKAFPEDMAVRWRGSPPSSTVVPGMDGRANYGGARDDGGGSGGRGGSYGKSSKNISETESMEELAVRSESISSC